MGDRVVLRAPPVEEDSGGVMRRRPASVTFCMVITWLPVVDSELDSGFFLRRSQFITHTPDSGFFPPVCVSRVACVVWLSRVSESRLRSLHGL